MSPIYQGTTPITKCYRGSVAISAIYRGTALLWSAAKPIVPATVRSFTQKGESGGATGSVNRTIAAPSPAPVAGDLLIFTVANTSGTGTDMTIPTNFIEIANISTANTAECNMKIGYRIATASEPTSYSYTNSTSYSHRADLVCVRDADTSRSPVVNISTGTTVPSSPTSTNPDTYPIPGVAAKTNHSLMLSTIATRTTTASTSNTFSWDWSTGMTEVTDSVGNNLITMTAATRQLTSTDSITGITSVLNRNTAEDRLACVASISIPSLNSIIPVAPTVSYYSGGSGGPTTNQIGQSYVSGGLTSTYHLYVEGLDWTKNVGIMIYTDGSGEFGLKNPTDPYLLAGTNGLIAKAQKHNMILLTPLAPGDGCLDLDGTCWYEDSLNGVTMEQKITWSYNLVKDIFSLYDIDKRRVVIGGYSSGAQWTTQTFGPRHSSEFMLDGVAVPISYGGTPVYTSTYNERMRANVPFRWVTGDQDEAWVQSTWVGAIQMGMDWYKKDGFNTAVRLLAGVGHTGVGISGEFGNYMDTEITAHVTPSRVKATYTGSPTSGTGGDLIDQNAIAWSNGTSSSAYHLRASHLAGKSGPFPVIFHWHGDGHGEYDNTTSGPFPAYVNEAVKAGAILVVAKTPDTVSPFTWWEDTTSVAYSVDFINYIYGRFNIDKKRVFLSGYSGGAELMSYNHLVDYHTLFEGGGGMMLGGGGVVYDRATMATVGFTGTPTQTLKDQFFLNWEVGDADNGVAPSDTTINALQQSQEGEKFFRDNGFRTERNIILGQNHFGSESFGPARLTRLINKSNMYYGLPLV